MEFTVAPGLLIAMPSLLDPNFFRSVVLLCAHSADGAFGLVINQQMEIPVASVCREQQIFWEGDANTKVFNGGPVDRQRGWLLHGSEHSFDGTEEVCQGIALATSHDALEAYGRDPTGRYRLLLGYAGWGPQQLDQEISVGAWLTAPVTAELVFDTPIESVWKAAMASVGVDPSKLVEPGTQVN